VEQAISECIQEGIMAEFLKQNRAEAKQVSIYEYDEEKHMRRSGKRPGKRAERLDEKRDEYKGEKRENSKGKLSFLECRFKRNW